MPAQRDTRREAARVRLLSPLQTFEDQSQTWGICCHSCTRREGLPPSARTYDPSSHISLTPLVAGGRNVGLLVVPARPAPRIPDAPDAVAGCTESDVSGAGRPARGPPTTCPAPVAAAYPAPVRSAASC